MVHIAAGCCLLTSELVRGCFFSVFQVHQSTAIVFIDSSSNIEERNLRVFMLCTHSIAGVLPLGILIRYDAQLGLF